VVRDPLLAEVLRGDRPAVSGRTVERRFRAATGLRQGDVRQIERARTAAQRFRRTAGAARHAADRPEFGTDLVA
jgi:methylphosphotriester-DNA--protein-cysteine methyltransferase